MPNTVGQMVNFRPAGSEITQPATIVNVDGYNVCDVQTVTPNGVISLVQGVEYQDTDNGDDNLCWMP